MKVLFLAGIALSMPLAPAHAEVALEGHCATDMLLFPKSTRRNIYDDRLVNVKPLYDKAEQRVLDLANEIYEEAQFRVSGHYNWIKAGRVRRLPKGFRPLKGATIKLIDAQANATLGTFYFRFNFKSREPELLMYVLKEDPSVSYWVCDLTE